MKYRFKCKAKLSFKITLCVLRHKDFDGTELENAGVFILICT